MLTHEELVQELKVKTAAYVILVLIAGVAGLGVAITGYLAIDRSGWISLFWWLLFWGALQVWCILEGASIDLKKELKVLKKAVK